MLFVTSVVPLNGSTIIVMNYTPPSELDVFERRLP